MTRSLSLLSDTSAVSYAFAVMVIALLFCTSVYILCIPIVNAIIGQFNYMIDQDMVSIGTQKAFNFNITMYKAMPIFAVIGFFLIYPIVIALLEKRVIE